MKVTESFYTMKARHTFGGAEQGSGEAEVESLKEVEEVPKES